MKIDLGGRGGSVRLSRAHVPFSVWNVWRLYWCLNCVYGNPSDLGFEYISELCLGTGHPSFWEAFIPLSAKWKTNGQINNNVSFPDHVWCISSSLPSLRLRTCTPYRWTPRPTSILIGVYDRVLTTVAGKADVVSHRVADVNGVVDVTMSTEDLW